MTNIIAIAKSGINVLTETDPNNFIFHSSYNTFKIIATGTVNMTSVANTDVIATVTHNLGTKNGFLFIWTDPHFSGLTQFHDNSNGTFHINGSGVIVADTLYTLTGWNNTTQLKIDYFDKTGGLAIVVRYYIFEVSV